MKIQDVVALKVNPKIWVKVLAINDEDIVRAELLGAPGVSFNINIVDLIDLGANEPGKELKGAVRVLGTLYKINLVDEVAIDKGMDGYTDFSTKDIYLMNLKQEPMSMADLKGYQKQVLRHEIIHAFLYESGLNGSSHSTGAFALDEELVDWLAIQSPKIWKAFEEAGCNE